MSSPVPSPGRNIATCAPEVVPDRVPGPLVAPYKQCGSAKGELCCFNKQVRGPVATACAEMVPAMAGYSMPAPWEGGSHAWKVKFTGLTQNSQIDPAV
jgi:hypothetical protein